MTTTGRSPVLANQAFGWELRGCLWWLRCACRPPSAAHASDGVKSRSRRSDARERCARAKCCMLLLINWVGWRGGLFELCPGLSPQGDCDTVTENWRLRTGDCDTLTENWRLRTGDCEMMNMLHPPFCCISMQETRGRTTCGSQERRRALGRRHGRRGDGGAGSWRAAQLYQH